MRSLAKGVPGIAAAAIVAACGSAAAGPPVTTMPTASGSAADLAALADSVRRSYTPADVDFMRGMIHHHAQALVMARMAPTHGASSQLRILTERIINAQRDEIALMERWLRDRGEPVPDVPPADAEPATHDPGMHMPGMLSEDQLARLDAARGDEFDRLFLQYMIQHHQGALVMVDELFATHGAAQEETTFKLASDIAADQSSEITRMQTMLQEILFGAGSRR